MNFIRSRGWMTEIRFISSGIIPKSYGTDEITPDALAQFMNKSRGPGEGHDA